ncbi:unnamed protein product [Pleuronectes platessa]|uniref:Uncharacterized protein n=1 Tax=Pleuronectes platessa TaxID=8262 RepID=A0A9N7YGV9_PLEPL|nr:unnamed protein product [Pleuronectes platessa]
MEPPAGRHKLIRQENRLSGLVHTWFGSELQTLQLSLNLNLRCERFLRPEEIWVWIQLNHRSVVSLTRLSSYETRPRKKDEIIRESYNRSVHDEAAVQKSSPCLLALYNHAVNKVLVHTCGARPLPTPPLTRYSHVESMVCGGGGRRLQRTTGVKEVEYEIVGNQKNGRKVQQNDSQFSVTECGSCIGEQRAAESGHQLRTYDSSTQHDDN